MAAWAERDAGGGAAFGGLVLISIAIHAAVIVLSTTFAHRVHPEASPTMELFPVELAPPKGVMEGRVEGTGTPLMPNNQPVVHRTSIVKTHAREEPREPTKPVEKKESIEDLHGEAMREAVRRTMLDPNYAAPSTAAGTGSAAPLGAPTGLIGGKGGSGSTHLGAHYNSMLSGWFSARVSLRGTQIPLEELKTLSVRASIAITPDRRVSSFTLQSSGNPVFDARIQSALQSIVSGGVMLPEPPEDEEVPPRITLDFNCRRKECS